jgi:hypothetical protein
MTDTNKLWLGRREPSQEESPIKILQEFADRLTQDTENVIEGEVIETYSGESNSEIVYAFYLVVPKLRDYMYRLFQITQENIAKEYPVNCILYTKSGAQPFEGENPQDFKEKLKFYFQSDYTQNILTSIFNHIDDVEENNKDEK